MKLYTEEQLVRAMSLAVYNKYEKYIEVLDLLTPIKLPSDEEIDNYADFAFPNAEKIGKETYSAFRGMKIGAKWVIEQIKQQNGRE